MNAETEDRAEATAGDHGDAAREQATPAFGEVFSAGAGLLAALRRVTTALAALLIAETRVLRASVAMVFLGSIALVAFSVSLWACVVALIGWALVVATGSVGIALLILVVLHLLLVVGIWFAIKRAIHHASFPALRAELHALGGELRGQVERFQRATPPPDREAPP
ncbi:MAG: hypothetical protein EPN36_14885 [Rhodanobacteraceae bacterium]|nr:MAG: hypothetical protein EPN36_14885 [Rhodanobacteraceae bacterium]